MDFNFFSLNNFNFTKKNQATRMKIGDALITLMATEDFNSIKIYEIAKAANVSRVTFYKYYHSKEEIVADYLQQVVDGYIQLNEGKLRRDFPNYDNILLAFNYFSKYEKFFLGLTDAGMYSILIEAVNKYMDEHVIPAFDISPYEIYYYAGGLLNTFIKWSKNGQNESAESIALKLS